MRCPRCLTLIAPPCAACTRCDFHVAALQESLAGAPERHGILVDEAQLLSKQGYGAIAERLSGFTRASGHDAVVVTLPTTGTLRPAEYAFGLFERWKVGGDAKDGIMLLLTHGERHLECVLGQALAPVLSPERANTLLARFAGPHLVRQDVDAGLYHGVDMVARVFEHAEGLR